MLLDFGVFLLPRLDVVPVLLLPGVVEFMPPFDGIDMPGDIGPDIVPLVDGVAPVLPDCAPIAPAPPPAEPPAD